MRNATNLSKTEKEKRKGEGSTGKKREKDENNNNKRKRKKEKINAGQGKLPHFRSFSEESTEPAWNSRSVVDSAKDSSGKAPSLPPIPSSLRRSSCSRWGREEDNDGSATMRRPGFPGIAGSRGTHCLEKVPVLPSFGMVGGGRALKAGVREGGAGTRSKVKTTTDEMDVSETRPNRQGRLVEHLQPLLQGSCTRPPHETSRLERNTPGKLRMCTKKVCMLLKRLVALFLPSNVTGLWFLSRKDLDGPAFTDT
ncbi:hypothetical protein LX32DRAFT_650921 [Colletotrichum zoysiae]|uniref:Uncharacterized protein n=1 Tax=Colletotrichum zoysiae TaxID=1216348 RepID=A0AAD9HNC5_9PEZI|nr:hypothetical protein LX32DRAFT_650921 [Colletotrichum zoysiae]